jgi:hypothetical protein
MPVAYIREQSSLAVHWEHIVYTLARLSAHPLGKPFVADFKALEKRLEALENSQRGTWRDEVIAQALVDVVDDDLDDATRALSRELSYADGEKNSRAKRYFAKPANRYVSLGLQSQLEVVEGWPRSLKAEPEAALKQLAARISAIIVEAKRALTGRSEAISARADHRVREVLAFVEDHNHLRLATHAALTSAAVKGRLARDFADRFFRRDSRASVAEVETDVPVPGTED